MQTGLRRNDLLYRKTHIMKHHKRITAICIFLALILILSACGANNINNNTANTIPNNAAVNNSAESNTTNSIDNEADNSTVSNNTADPGTTVPSTEKNGEIYILFTRDVHCGIDQGFGYAGLMQIRETLENKGYTTILVDNGDSIQGEAVGTMSKGEAIIEIMNTMHYDIAIPGNHEFDYGTERFLEVAKMAEFPYISCNFNKEGELVFKPYIIKEAAGIKIAFIGITTPETITSSTPEYFQNDKGEYIYGFLQDGNGETLYNAVQKAVNDARAEGADLVYVLGHMGMAGSESIWSYADIIENTEGIDVFLDGHSHDTGQIVMKNKNGDDVVRSACGTKLSCIGYSHITSDGKVVETNIWRWPNSICAQELLGIKNAASEAVDNARSKLAEQLDKVVARTDVDLTINDPVEIDNFGNPIRMIRRAETNLGDLCADAFRISSGADIAVMNGGAIRTSIKKGDITFGDIISVFPFGNYLCVIEATGQQILDVLEWGAKGIPGEFGGFLQVSGLSYTIDPSIPSPCKADENNMCVSIEGPRRVSDVTIGGEALDPDKTYTVAGADYTLLSNGDGITAFNGCRVLQDRVRLDNQLLIDFIADTLGGKVGTEYADPYGEGRITIKQ